MTAATIFIVLGLVALILTIYLAKGHLSKGGDLEKLAIQLRPVDIGAFCNLISASEQEYLREHLPPREFRSIHRERMGAAVEYVRCAAHNASIRGKIVRKWPALAAVRDSSHPAALRVHGLSSGRTNPRSSR